MATATATRRVVPVPRDRAAPWRHLDLVLLGAVVGIAVMGVLMVYSATRHRQELAGLNPQHYLNRQALYLFLGLVTMAVVTAIDYRVLRDLAPALYAGTVVALVLVLSPLGTEARGAQSWFQLGPFQLEPSELAKVALIVCLASYCAMHRDQMDRTRVLTVLGLAGVPMVLIYLQPDVGTDLVFGVIIVGILLVAGARPRHLALLGLAGVVCVVAVLQLGVLKQYQLDRLGAFLNPEGDTQASAYNLHQSVTAIAAGGLAGRGLFQGTQTRNSFVPEQHTDFIFTALGEELGFAGAVTVLALFALVIWRTWRTAVLARDRLGMLICVGVLSMLVFQVFENVGMSMGIMPITGIPLPFMSYGGSATVACFAAIGLVMNVHMRRFS